MPRKRKGALPSGSVRVQVFVGTRQDGTRRYESFTGKTRQEAQAAAAAFRIRASRMKAAGVPVDDIPREDVPVTPKDTVARLLEDYLETCRATGLSPSTLLSYSRVIRRAYGPLKPLTPDRLSVPLLQSYVNARLNDGLTAKTIRGELSLLACALRPVRPDLDMRLIRLPKQRKREMQIPTTDDVQRMITAAKGTELYIPLLLAALMGLRRSEICGLRWSDVDLRRHTLHVHSAVVRGESSAYEAKGPKTEAGDRVIPIPSALVPVLKAARTLDANVTRLTPDAITRRYERLTDALGVPGRFHDLRHYHASSMIAAGAPDKYICADMGHATMDMVRRVYGHVMADRQQEINEEMNARASAFSL